MNILSILVVSSGAVFAEAKNELQVPLYLNPAVAPEEHIEVDPAANPSRHPASADRSLAAIAKPSRFFGEGQFVPAPVGVYQELPQSPLMKPEAYIPLDLAPTEGLSEFDKSQIVGRRIADHSLSSLFNSPEFRGSAIGSAATKVEQTVKQEVVIPVTQDNPIEHKFNFNLQAFQTTARVAYTGIARVELVYNFRFQTTDFAVSEKFGTNKEISVVHSQGPLNYKMNHLRMSWSF